LAISSWQLAIERIEICNALGQKVFSQKSEAGSQRLITIDVSELKPGIYFLSVVANGSISTKKVVIQN